jgi:hypothetical protein
MDVTDAAVAWAKTIAADDSHGYDQAGRWGPDYDCSSLVISAYKKAGVPLTCTYTGNMRGDMLSHGFRDVTGEVGLAGGAGLKKGDVLLHETHHTALYIGDGRLLHAAGNEYGRATGGKTGDQTGKEICITGYFNFPWQYVLRYEGKEESSDPGYRLYTVQPGDSFWRIAEQQMGNGMLYDELRKFNNINNYYIYPGQVLKIPITDPPEPPEYESVTVKLKKTVLEKMKNEAKDKGITLSELIEGAFK